MPLFGAVEIGGTKTDMALGTTADDLSTPHRVPSSNPGQTVNEITQFFTENRVEALGVACFGPLELTPGHDDYGTIVSTPKEGWSGAPIHRELARRLGMPVAIDVDVVGSALGEGRWGAARGMTDYVYITVGTGIGAGVVVDGRPISGERHPETGHIVVVPHPEDDYVGRCPYHGSCLEGMASGPALEDRFGNPETWAGNDSLLDLVTHYLAQAVRNLVYTVAPERIVIGGGVSRLPRFHHRLRERSVATLAGYPHDPDLDLLISKPGLGELSGLAGALVLAERAT